MKRKLSTPLAVAAASAAGIFVLACSDYSTRGAGNAFVGTWACPSLPAAEQTLEITENLDDSLTIAIPADAGVPAEAGGPALCPTDEWTFSGSTATMQAGTSCLAGADGGEVVTVQSFTLTVTGNTLKVNAAETVAGATTQKLTLAGSCSKQ